jgi:hypothetical protein
VITKRARKPAQTGDPSSTVRPKRRATKKTATLPAATDAPIDRDQLDATILRTLRRFPNQTVDLAALANELKIDPYRLQLAVESLGRRRMVVVPFIEPDTAGGAELTEAGLRWLIAREGGKPVDKPAAVKVARKHVRTSVEAARLPRAVVYGVSRGS